MYTLVQRLNEITTENNLAQDLDYFNRKNREAQRLVAQVILQVVQVFY